ncbi:MAG: hypothetical protein U1E65_15130 [Myxococcota bacterium]
MSSLGERARGAAWVAGAAYLVAALHAAHVAHEALPEGTRARAGSLSPDDILRADLLRLAVVILMSALIGALFSQRNGLLGLGSLDAVRRSWRWTAAGGALSLSFYLALGAAQAARFPAQYPCGVVWASLAWLKASVSEEVIARYGMMTLVTGVLRHRTSANLVQAVFFTMVSLRSLTGAEGVLDLDSAGWWSLGSTFLVHLASGFVYARYGLVAAFGLRASTGLRLLLHPALGCG